MIPAAIFVWVVLIPASVIAIAWVAALRRERRAARRAHDLPVTPTALPVTRPAQPVTRRGPRLGLGRPDCAENAPARPATDRGGEARRARS